MLSAITLSREFQLLFEGIGEAVGPIFSVHVGENSKEGLRSIYSLASMCYRRFFAIPSMMFIGSDISRAVALSREN